MDAASELRALEFWRALIAECLGTFVYVFLVCGAAQHRPGGGALARALCSGAASAAACGALRGPPRFNPALTLAALATRRITPLRALLCSAAQCGGAVAAAALLYGVTEEVLCSTVSTVGPWRACLLEGVMTFVVALASFASGDALAVGSAHLACSLVALPSTGASMNPARSLGPAFVMNTWTHHWVYWCGPCAGGVLAGLIYEYIFDSPRKEQRLPTEPKSSTVMRRCPSTERPGLSRKHAGVQIPYYSTVPRAAASQQQHFKF